MRLTDCIMLGACISLVFAMGACEISKETNLNWEALETEMTKFGIEAQFATRAVLLLYGNYQVYRSESGMYNLTEIVQSFTNDVTSLKDRPSINEATALTTENVSLPEVEDFAQVLKLSEQSLGRIVVDKTVERKVLHAIKGVLRFYEYESDEITNIDTGLALIFLKGIDDKHGGILQQTFPIGEWIERQCKYAEEQEGKFCKTLASHWKNRSGTSGNREYWKAVQVLQKRVNQMENQELENIGNEKEGIWGPLNGQCQTAIVSRCEIPYVCERTLLDPTPRSQYLLTHQLLQRLLIETMDCPSTKSFVTEQEIYTSLCTKMYLEAKYLDILDVPIVHRDLFAETIAFGSYMGYTNFLREDWLDRILSWQSKSDSGCFIQDPSYPAGVLSTDVPFKRRATQNELFEGVQPNEKCLPHLTAVGLTALSVYWDYLMDQQ